MQSRTTEIEGEEAKGGGAQGDVTVSQSGNKTSYFSALSSFVPQLASEWSFAQLRLEANTHVDE